MQTDRLVLCILVALCVAYYALISFFLIYYFPANICWKMWHRRPCKTWFIWIFKFLPISNLTGGECKSNLITTEYCDSFIVRSLIITASQANSYGQFWVDSLTKLHSKSRWFKDWLHFFIVKPLVTSSLRLLPDSLQALGTIGSKCHSLSHIIN